MAELNIMPWYTDAYLADTLHLTAEEHGAYCLILMAMWRAGAELPDDADVLCRIAKVAKNRWPKVWGMIQKFFYREGGVLRQKRLFDEWQKANAKKIAAKGNG